jgi:hypothetical protein
MTMVQLLKISVMADRGRFLNTRALSSSGSDAFFFFNNEGFHLVRNNLDNERVVFRVGEEEMVAGLRRKLLTRFFTCVIEVGVIADFVDFLQGFWVC